jgi:hypothetical protein
MADYRQIHVTTWDDDWFCQLNSDEKVVFIWLFSNRRANVSGLYEFTEFICSRETGIELNSVHEAIKKLQNDKKIFIENGWVWVKNLRKYNDSKSPNTIKSINNDLEKLPDMQLKRDYIAYYKELEAPSKPLPAPTKHPLEQEQEREQEREQEQESEPGNFAIFDDTFKTKTHLHYTPMVAIEAFEKITKAGATLEDMVMAIDQMIEKRYSLVSPASIVNPTINCMNYRIRKESEKVTALKHPKTEILMNENGDYQRDELGRVLYSEVPVC